MRRRIRGKTALIPTAVFLTFFWCGAALFAGSAPDGDPAAGPMALRAAKVFTGAGAVHENGVVLIRGGKIEAVGTDIALPAGCPVVDFGEAVIVPGLIDPDTSLGAAGQVAERADALQPAAAAENVFDRFSRDFDRALAQGITSVLITPSGENIVGGSAVAVKTSGRSDCRVSRILRTGGPLVLTLDGTAYRYDRMPTSRMGAIDLFRRTLDEASAKKVAGRGGKADRLASFASGRLDGFLRVGARYDIASAIDFKEKYGLNVTLLGVHDAWRMMDELKQAGLPLIMGPFPFSTSERILRVPARASKAGVKFAFTGGAASWNPVLLRTTAALAVQSGLDRETALKALTLHPAEITGIAHRVGSIAAGKDADLVVFSGDPIDLTSRVLKVYIDGIPVFRGCSGLCKCAGSEECK